MPDTGVLSTGQEVTGVPGGRRERSLLGTLGWMVPFVLLVVNIVRWLLLGQSMGGFEVVVRRADFVSNLTGATILHAGNGAHLYDLQVQHDAQKAIFAPYVALGPSDLLPYNHLPFEAMLTAPLIGLPYTFIFIAWSVLMLAVLGLALLVLHRTLPVAGQAGAILTLSAVSYQPVIRSFILGQNSPLVLLGLCGTYAAIRGNRPLWAGAALVLVALKPQILPAILLLLLLERRWQVLAVFAGLFSLLCAAAMPLLGVDWPFQYARLLLGVAGWHDTGAIDPTIMANWRGFAANLLGALPSLVTPVFVLLSAASAVLLVWAWAASRRQKVRGAGDTDSSEANRSDLLWALTGIVAVLTSLHLNPHDLLLLIFPAWIICRYSLIDLPIGRPRTRWPALLWAGYLVAIIGAPSLFVILNVLIMSAAALYLMSTLAPGTFSTRRTPSTLPA